MLISFVIKVNCLIYMFCCLKVVPKNVYGPVAQFEYLPAFQHHKSLPPHLLGEQLDAVVLRVLPNVADCSGSCCSFCYVDSSPVHGFQCTDGDVISRNVQVVHHLCNMKNATAASSRSFPMKTSFGLCIHMRLLKDSLLF